MSIRDWDLPGELFWFGDELSHLGFRIQGHGARPPEPGSRAPQVDIHENDEAVILLLDLPGVRKEDISLQLYSGSLTLEGKRTRLAGTRDVRLERPAGRFRRSFRIGVPVEPAKVQARYRDGVLEITLPKPGPGGPAAAGVRLAVE